MKTFSRLFLVGMVLCWIGYGAESASKADSPDESAVRSEVNPKALDGVVIEAVERYPNPKTHEVGFGLGVYPFKAFYYGFSLNADYVTYFNKYLAWEVLNASMAFTVQTNLSSVLADKWNVTPDSIEKLRGVFSSNVMYVHSHGKLLFLDRFIRYFRSYVIGGLGVVTTSQKSEMGVNLGVRLDAYVSDSFSWKFEVRDMITFNSFENFAMVSIGTGINF